MGHSVKWQKGVVESQVGMVYLYLLRLGRLSIAQAGLSLYTCVVFTQLVANARGGLGRHSMLSFLWVPSRGVEAVSPKAVGWMSWLVRALDGSVAS